MSGAQKRNWRLFTGQVRFILPSPAKLRGTIRWEGVLSVKYCAGVALVAFISTVIK